MTARMSSQIPDHFLGSFTLEKSEHFDEFLKTKGVNWMLRKMMQMASLTKIIKKNDDGTYTMESKSTKKDLIWTFTLGQSFEAEAFDGTIHKIRIFMQGDDVCEAHTKTNVPDAKEDAPAVYTRDGDYLIMHHTAGDVKCRRWLKKNA